MKKLILLTILSLIVSENLFAVTDFSSSPSGKRIASSGSSFRIQ